MLTIHPQDQSASMAELPDAGVEPARGSGLGEVCSQKDRPPPCRKPLTVFTENQGSAPCFNIFC